ncbi:acyltransferase, partial [Candidatus Bathyarchaeota archaeon]|nr:acyltransferase [Candidatus Bathyarchaeota archaeon]
MFSFLSNIEERIFSINSQLYIKYLRKKGVTVGEATQFFGNVLIDVTRPLLVEIGANCVFTGHVTLLTHGYEFSVLQHKYGKVLGSSGKVVVEDNVFIGFNTIILKGTRIGRDSIIGAGSVVTSNSPARSVAAGNPCRVIMTLDDYYEKRKQRYVNEAKAYALEVYQKTGRVPEISDFWEEVS